MNLEIKYKGEVVYVYHDHHSFGPGDTLSVSIDELLKCLGVPEVSVDVMATSRLAFLRAEVERLEQRLEEMKKT